MATGVYDGSYMYVYINGQLYQSKNVGSHIIYYEAAAAMGIGSGVNQRYMDGVIDDLRIYSRALSAQEVADLYNATK